jgi:hypothetical protein
MWKGLRRTVLSTRDELEGPALKIIAMASISKD